MTPGVDEFDTIARLFAPLAKGAPGAFGLLDDAAVLSLPMGEELVVTADAVVEGVHFLPDDPLDLVARKLLRVNLSDLAAKAAEPFAYLLTVAWSPRCDWPKREAFAAGLARDQAEFGVQLIGGDTVSTAGPLTASITAFGRVSAGRMVTRAGARAADRLFVSGTIGDGFLGLKAARGEWVGEHAGALATRYQLPEPRLEIRDRLRATASAAADVSDGLLADAGRIALASGLKVVVELDRLPISPGATEWLGVQDRETGLIALATGGDDYEVVCASVEMAGLTEIGWLEVGAGVEARLDGVVVSVHQTGWRHG